MEDEMEGGCPLATRDLTLNLKNRGKAIDKADYGPMDPNLPNNEYWARMASKWDTDPAEARQMLCGNCAAFNKTSAMLKCIEEGLAKDRMQDAMEVVEAGDLGYCEVFDFKCAAKRTCAAWIVGGPVEDEESDEEEYEDEGESEDEEYSDMRPGEG